MKSYRSLSVTRRQFVVTSAMTAGLLGISTKSLEAARTSSGTFVRHNLNDPAAKRDLDSYERAITKMLSLPPSDPRNWFRIAIVHLLDCPHGNWWFLPWHRGFLGYFELICRELSEDPEFALPYWDWTEQPQLPTRFVNGMLNPANFGIPSVIEFRKQFEKPLQNYWDGLAADQKSQLALRSINSIDDVWKQIEGKSDPADTAPMFATSADARQLNPPHTLNLEPVTAKAVSISTVLDGLAPRDFETFGSGKQINHQLPSVSGVLESQPHNLVHNEVGGYVQGNPSRQGFMTGLLSPSDPIFFMHHSNIDRLWDVWTRKQLSHNSRRYPTVPPDADIVAWNSEAFLFFIGADGKPSPKKQSGDFVDIAAFNYKYQPGSGEIVVPSTPPINTLAAQAFKSKIAATTATADIPEELMTAVPSTAASNTGVRLVAKITVILPKDSRDLKLHAILNPPEGATTISLEDPGYIGTFQLFGHQHGAAEHQSSQVTFSLGLTDAVRRLQKTDRLKPGAPFNIRIVAQRAGINLQPVTVTVIDTTVQAL